MASITTRAGKSSPLTHNEVDANFNNLNTDKLDTAGIALGSAANPTIKFTGDTNTGIYSPGADQLAVSTGGTGRLFVDSAGKLSIGTTSSSINILTLKLPAGNANQFTIAHNNEATYGRLDIGLFENGVFIGTYQGSNSASDLIRFGTNGFERVRVDSSGRLLVGTSTASTIGPSIDAGFQIEATGLAAASLFNNSNNVAGAYLTLGKSRGTAIGSSTIVNNNDELGGIYFAGADGVDRSQSGGSITVAVDGTPGTNDMPGRLVFSTTADGAASPTERLRITSAGRVGIGTTSPDSVLSIDGASNLGALGSGAPVITLKNTDTTNFNAAQIINRDSGGNIAGGISFRNGSHGASGNSDIVFHTRNAGTVREPLVIGTTGTTTLNAAASTAPFIAQINTSEVARIDSSGRLLVGTSTSIGSSVYTSNYSTAISPRLQIAGTTVDTASVSIQNYQNFGGANPGISLCKSNSGTVGTFTATLASGNSLGAIVFNGDDSAKFVAGAAIEALVDGTPGANDMPGRLVFSTTADGAAGPTERLRITSAGVLQVADASNIQVGTTTGTKIGTATTQKLGFYNATPVVQPTAVADATDAASAITQLNALLTRMRNLGLIAT